MGIGHIKEGEDEFYKKTFNQITARIDNFVGFVVSRKSILI